MNNILWVGLGGFVGSVGRYLVSGWIMDLAAPGRFPYGTLAVNILGCLCIGLLTGLGERYAVFNAETRLLVFTGLLGGFTTFSSFGLDAMQLLRRSELWLAGVYVGSTVIIGLFAVWLGLKLMAVWPQ